MAQTATNLPAVKKTWVRPLGWEYSLEKGMATHCSILAWRIPCTEEPGGLQSKESQRVRHARAPEHSHTRTLTQIWKQDQTRASVPSSRTPVSESLTQTQNDVTFDTEIKRWGFSWVWSVTEYVMGLEFFLHIFPSKKEQEHIHLRTLLNVYCDGYSFIGKWPDQVWKGAEES